MSSLRSAGSRLFVAVLAAVALLGLAVSPAAANSFDDPLPVELRDWVDANGPIRIGYAATAAPVGIVEDGEVTGGWAWGLHELIAIKLGIEIEHVAYPDVPTQVAALFSGEVDLLAANGERPDLLEGAQPTAPMSWTPFVLVGNDDAQLRGLGALDGRTVTTIPGSPIVNRIAAELPSMTYVEVANLPEGLAKVEAGEIEFFAGPLAIIGYQLGRLGIDLGPVGDPISIGEIPAWGLPESEAIQIATIGRDLLTDAELSVIHVRWTGFDLTDPDGGVPGWLLPTFLIALAVVLVLTLFSLVLRRRVRLATAELEVLNEELEDRVAERTAELGSANSRLRSANKALSGFAKTAAHDLRGPITAIKGLTQLLRTVDLGEDKQGEILETIESSSGRLDGMIKTMLDDAMEAGAEDPGVDGPGFITWLRGVVAPELEVVGADLTVTAPEGLVPVDASALRRIAVNLVGNALKYAVNEQGMKVAVALAPHDEGTWQLTCEDNGPGVPQALWSKVFEPGYRMHTDDRGKGLGLSEIRELLQSGGGSIRIGDSPMGGAAFVVLLPVVPRPAEGRVADPSTEAATTEGS